MVHLRLLTTILLRHRTMEEQSLPELTMTCYVYWWMSKFLRSKSSLLNGTKIWNQIEIPIWMIQVRRWIAQIAVLDWFDPLWNEKSNFRSQNLDLVWSKGMQSKLLKKCVNPDLINLLPLCNFVCSRRRRRHVKIWGFNNWSLYWYFFVSAQSLALMKITQTLTWYLLW